MSHENYRAVGIRSAMPAPYFFQAEDGIRDYKVTGVQTCALPILEKPRRLVSISAPNSIKAARPRCSHSSSRITNKEEPFCRLCLYHFLREQPGCRDRKSVV